MYIWSVKIFTITMSRISPTLWAKSWLCRAVPGAIGNANQFWDLCKYAAL